MSDTTLEKRLGEIIDVLAKTLAKQGLFISDKEKQQIKLNVSDNLTAIGFTDKNNDNALRLACICEFAKAKNIGLDKLDYTTLLKPKNKITDAELKAQLKLIFSKFAKFKHGANAKEFDKFLDELMLILKNPKKSISDENKNQKTEEKYTEIDPRIEQLMQLYGINTQNPGSITPVIVGVPFGDQMGLTDNDNNPNSTSFMAESNAATLGQSDYIGIKFLAVLESAVTGVVVADTLKISSPDQAASQSPSYTSPSPFRNPNDMKLKRD